MSVRTAIRAKRRGQLDLFAFASTILPPASSESDKLYLNVMYLRSHGHRVYRAGVQKHLLDGDVVSTRTLLTRGGCMPGMKS